MLRLTVSRLVQETPDAVSIHFPQPKVHKIWYKAGQFLTIAVVIEGKRHYRSYSICTAPRLDDTLAITVKRVEGGLVSNFLNDHVQVGDEFDALKPAGKFLIENSVKFERHVWLFGAGSGITPLFSILRSVLFNEPKSIVSLLFANRSQSDIIFHDQLGDLLRKFPQRLQVKYFLSQGKAEGLYQSGRVTADRVGEMLKELLAPQVRENVYYMCGPEGFMTQVKKGLLGAHIPEESVHIERFTAEALPLSIALDAPARPLKIFVNGEELSFTVPPGTHILQSALQQGYDLPYSCQQGICTTCVGRVVNGNVTMDRNEGLTVDEVEKGFVLLCQAHPLTDGVEVRIGEG